MPNYNSEGPLWSLFLAENKAEFLKRADEVTLSAKVIERTALFAATKQTPLRHMIGKRETHPVTLTDDDWKRVDQTKKAGKLLAAIKEHNRAIFHAFWFEVEAKGKPWWLISYDLRDRETHSNHWKATGLPHAHIISYLTHPRDQLETHTTALAKDPKHRLPHAVHVRFEDDGWRDFIWGPAPKAPL